MFSSDSQRIFGPPAANPSLVTYLPSNCEYVKIALLIIAGISFLALTVYFAGLYPIHSPDRAAVIFSGLLCAGVSFVFAYHRYETQQRDLALILEGTG